MQTVFPPVLGMTLSEYAASEKTSTQAVRSAYRNALRYGAGLGLPLPVRGDESEGVRKFCLPIPGERSGLETESVIIPMRSFRGSRWHSVCVSSQVGCRMACTFCETARMGLVRSLSAAEIVGQFVVARSMMAAHDEAQRPYRYFNTGIQNIVFMGMGEPLDNFDEVTQAIRVLAEPNGIALPYAQMTVSTVGRVEGIRRLAALRWINLRLAISLNAGNDRLRSEIMPINKASPLSELHKALREYPLAPRGRFMFEYVLLKDVNDSLSDAREVADFCRDLPGVVNLIPYNPQRDAIYETSTEAAIFEFFKELRRQGIFVKRRLTHGRDLMGACGQLGNPTIRRGAPSPPS